MPLLRHRSQTYWLENIYEISCYQLVMPKALIMKTRNNMITIVSFIAGSPLAGIAIS